MNARFIQMILLTACVPFSHPNGTSINVNPQFLSVMPGQWGEVQITVTTEHQSGPVIVTSNITMLDKAKLISSKSGPWLVSGKKVVSIAIQGEPNETVSINFIVTENFAHAEVSAELIPCWAPFEFDNSTKQCVCTEHLVSIGVYCSVGSGSIAIPNSLWFGPISLKGEKLTLGTIHCLEDYCKSSIANISNNDFDIQCSGNRVGVGCGSCLSDNSRVLGSSQCQECTNSGLFFILLFLGTGLLTVVGIILLRITIAEGYLNGLLFYCNIANLFAKYFTPPGTGKGAFLLTAWISQNFGISVCFYDGMTTLAVTGLSLLYIFYLFALTGSLALVMHFKQSTSTENYAPSKVIGTLLILCYTSLLEICVGIVSFILVTTLEGETLVRWHYDANVTYFSGFHTFLLVIAILIFLLFLLPVPFLVISPRITYKVRLFNKLQPLLDTFWAPFKPKYCWWLSFRLLLRWFVVFVVSFVSFPHDIIGTSILLALLLFVQSQVKPFRGHWRNVADEALVLNLLVLLVGRLIFTSLDYSINEVASQIYGALLVAIAYLLFVATFLYHLSLRFPKLKPFTLSFLLRIKNLLLCHFRDRYFTIEGSDTLDLEPLASENPLPAVTHFEINIPKEEKEKDKQNLAKEVQKLEEGAKANNVDPKSNPPMHATKSPSLNENNEGFPLLTYRDCTEDREPLLAGDNI